MKENYKKAPDILTNKDLDYLKDIFGWNHTAYKNEIEALNNIEDKSVQDMIKEAAMVFEENMHSVLQLVKDEHNGK